MVGRCGTSQVTLRTTFVVVQWHTCLPSTLIMCKWSQAATRYPNTHVHTLDWLVVTLTISYVCISRTACIQLHRRENVNAVNWTCVAQKRGFGRHFYFPNQGKSNSAAIFAALSMARIGWTLPRVGNFISISTRPTRFRGWRRERQEKDNWDIITMGMKIAGA